MKKVLAVLLLIAFVTAGYGYAIASDAGHQQPAPNSGDGIPDGSGFDTPNGPNNSDSGSGQGHRRPAPNSGDGIPDGPGW
jgi:hypothetical protein